MSVMKTLKPLRRMVKLKTPMYATTNVGSRIRPAAQDSYQCGCRYQKTPAQTRANRANGLVISHAYCAERRRSRGPPTIALPCQPKRSSDVRGCDVRLIPSRW